MPQHGARRCSGVPAVVHHHLAVDNHVGNAQGELLGVGAGCRRFHRLGIEYHNVRLCAVSQYTSLPQSQPLCGKGSHLAYGLGESELLFSAYKLGQNNREAPVCARAGPLPKQDSVAGHHAMGVRHKIGKRLRVGPHRHERYAQVLGEQ